MLKRLTLSVHNLVDFLLRKGSIDSRVFNVTAMTEGTRLHAFLQAKMKAAEDHYIAEFYLEHTFNLRGYEITLQGRADGVVKTLDGGYIVDEIKSTVADLEEFHENNETWHLGQVQCYALMLAYLYDLDQVTARLTYLSQVNKDRLVKFYTYKVEQLEQIVFDLLNRYIDFYDVVINHITKRNESAKLMRFPFETLRKGQKRLAGYTYAVSKQGGSLYVEAPTGIGKTISTLYPAVYSFSDEVIEKIFYLTAKTSGQVMAFDTVKLMNKSGLIAKSIVITAKDKVCLNQGSPCNPDACPFAKDYYSKLQGVLFEMLSETNNYDANTLEQYALKHTMCPFELQLDLSLFCDIIIGDYNYLFDPLVYLKRFFDTSETNYFGLIDEAHNLVDRARLMYSGVLYSRDFNKVKKLLRPLEHKKMKSALRQITTQMNKLKREFADKGEIILEKLPSTITRAFNNFISAGQHIMRHEEDFISDEFSDFFFAVNRFLKIYEYYDDTYVLYFKSGKSWWELNLFNLDPKENVADGLSKLSGAVLFSATLSPSDYYVNLLGGNKQSPLLKLASPFPEENRKILVGPNIETTYRKRDESYEEIAEYIDAFVHPKVGNYLVFFPSYKYLQSVETYLSEINKRRDYNLIVQNRNMSKVEQDEFLAEFKLNPTQTTIGLAVMGGVFGEGIDLSEDRLIGAVVVGVGIPQIGFERNLIKEYYDEQSNIGFNYAYTYPGMNRVAQAIGRVIRSEEDKGAILLIDSRYTRRNYAEFISSLTKTYEYVYSPAEIEEKLTAFWENNR